MGEAFYAPLIKVFSLLMVASPFVCICCVLEMKTISLVLLVLYYFHLVTVKGFHIGK